MAKPLRRKCYFVDRKVQGALLTRVIRYWFMSLFAVGSLTLIGWIFVYPGIGEFVSPGAIMPHAFPIFVMALASAVLLLPIAILDVVRLSNRFAGPMLRLRRAMRELAAGENVQPINLRDDDFWQEFAESFNALLQRLDLEDSEPGNDVAESAADVDTVSDLAAVTPTVAVGAAVASSPAPVT